MKNTIKSSLVILIFLATPWPAFSQHTGQVTSLYLETSEFDFGKVNEGSRMTHTFTVQNKGGMTLEIKKVSPG